MRGLVVVVMLLFAGCLGSWSDKPSAPSGHVTALDLVEGPVAMPYQSGWTGTVVETNETFWDRLDLLRTGSSVDVGLRSGLDGYVLFGVRAMVDGAWSEASILALPSGGVRFTWDAAVVGDRPHLQLLLLGGGPEGGDFVAVFGDFDRILGPTQNRWGTLNGTDGGAGLAVRIPFNDTHVLLHEQGVVDLEETYTGGVATPAGWLLPRRQTSIQGVDRLSGAGLASWTIVNVDPAGAAVWSETTTAPGHQSSFTGAGTSPVGGQADAQLMAWQSEVGAGDIRIELTRDYTGLATSPGLGASTVLFVCGWADVDVASLGWDVPTWTPQDLVVERALGLVPLGLPVTSAGA